MQSQNNPEAGPGFRANVGIMVVNQKHLILAGQAFYYPGEWLMPQGGIDPSERPTSAMQRELEEETGLSLDQMRLIHELEDWQYYLFKKPQYKDDIFYKGQRQKWFLLEYNGPLPDTAPKHLQEFTHFDWVEPDWLIQNTATFLADVYRKVIEGFKLHLP
ncbi:MAG: putative (di)nucleoside polyphosphate hydrolase [Parasphingorhabdus sp.]|jgi:putative (di)nucleoside polyphosphate hydrolase